MNTIADVVGPAGRMAGPAWGMIASLLAAGCFAADAVQERFSSAEAVSRFRIVGDAGFDAAKSASADGSGSLRLGAKSRAVLPLRDVDGSGRVTFKVYDDRLAPADPQSRAGGALAGVQQADGLALMVGAIYAPYLSGAQSLALTNHTPGKDVPHIFVRHLGIPRVAGWKTWRFDFDAAKGLSISCDGTAVESRRFDWKDSRQAGFNALVFAGDASGGGSMQWIDDIEVVLGGPMQVAPTLAAPLAIVPDADPPAEAGTPDILPALRDVHPRLLFGPEDVPRLRAFYASEEARPFREALLGYLGSCNAPAKTDFLTDATDGQRQGYWRLPTVALHYVLTGDRTSFDRAVAFLKVFNGLPDWETPERNAGMSAANIMIGAGLALDWLWNDLDPAFREEFRRKCLWHARAMYHGGHLGKAYASIPQYWQNDPANNHRWHRDAGMASCIFAAYSGAPEERWILSRLREDLDYIVRWLPEDGTSHESPVYMVFGLSHLVLATQMADRCLGTSFQKNPFFAAVPRFMAQTMTPDRKARFNYGDMEGVGVGKLGYDTSLLRLAALNGLRDEQDALMRQMAAHGTEWGWMGLLWFDPAVGGGDAGRLATTAFFPDVGVLFARDGWKDDGVGVMFKCGPFGGYTLNRFRHAAAGEPRYINVAHDDPDANSFLIYARGRYLAETDRYSEAKMSANHNTILVNGLGQMSAGRAEGGVWSQPGGDMRRMGVITAVKTTPRVDAVEGEAAGSYLAVPGKRPALQRFRRALAFVKDGYVLVLDDIRAPEAVEITWMVQAPELRPDGTAAGRWALVNGDAACPFAIASSRDDGMRFAVVASPAGTKKRKAMGWNQLRATVTTDALRQAAVFDVHGKGLRVAIDGSDARKLVVSVSGGGIEDRWEWAAPEHPSDAFALVGRRGGEVLVEVGPADRPAEPEQP